jgi:putative ABC transport system substrate-binding protein
MTGITFFTVELGAKRLQLLHELVPSAKVIAQVLHARTQETASSVRDVHAAADTLGLHVILLKAGSGDELDAAFVAASERHVDALIFGPDPNFIQYRDRAIALAARFAIPTIYPERVYVEKGGLLSYGQSLVGIYREVGVYVGHVLAGARPADMPVLRSTEFELVINRKTAAALRLDVPPSLLARADEVIE